MPKTLSPAEILSEEVELLEDLIAAKERDLLEQKNEVAEFSESLRLFSLGVDRFVPSGRLAAMDAINIVLDEASNQDDRNYRWNVCQQASQLAQQAVATLSSELQELRQRLAIARTELDWQQNFQPFAEKYRSGFTMPSPEQRKQEKVRALEQDIADRQEKFGRARSWLSQPEGSRPYYAGDPLREAQYLSEAIPVLTGQLERLRGEPVAKDPKYDQAFRQYVRARVAVEPTLAAFLEVQGEYLTALEQFKQAIAQHPQACEFPSAALTEPRVVSGDGAIRLV